jgi:2-polyprenyl-3-methyl-5-hydroxy-6-metoxy-1,4-benzoquinol methylase
VTATDTVDTTNFAKFQTGNPVVRRLIDRFYARLRSIVAPLGGETVLDAGCGEGETIARLRDALPERVSAVDILDACVAYTKQRLPFVDVSRQSVYELPFPDDAFDLVLSLEVLEHLDDPAAGVRELSRVARSDLVVSVPFEPYFRLGSLLRGKYVTGLGNHPEHVNHWNRRSLADFLGGQLDVVSVGVAFPWLIAHCRPRENGISSA